MYLFLSALLSVLNQFNCSTTEATRDSHKRPFQMTNICVLWRVFSRTPVPTSVPPPFKSFSVFWRTSSQAACFCGFFSLDHHIHCHPGEILTGVKFIIRRIEYNKYEMCTVSHLPMVYCVSPLQLYRRGPAQAKCFPVFSVCLCLGHNPLLPINTIVDHCFAYGRQFHALFLPMLLLFVKVEKEVMDSGTYLVNHQ